MGKYKVLHPIAFGGRRERGEVVSIPDSEAPSYVKPGLVEAYGGEVEAVNENEEKSLDEMSAAELKAKAKDLGLPTTGTKADLQERIELHLQDDEGDDDEGGDAAPTADDAPSEGGDDESDESDDSADDEEKE